LTDCQDNSIPINPNFLSNRSAKEAFLEFAKEFVRIDDRSDIARFRKNTLQASRQLGKYEQEFRVCISTLCDLRTQGWTFLLDQSQLWGRLPVRESESPSLEKQRVRESHLFERDAQLRDPATREFVRGMERIRLGTNKWVSVLSVIRDGTELSAKLRAANKHADKDEKLKVLRRCIDPYIQIVDTNSTCQFTGLRLFDIWRYFRHTWVIPYYTVPGRQIPILIRDAAAENHPIIGIAALGSSVVQLTPRDNWIGWTPSTFMEELRQNPTRRWANWVWSSWHQLVKAIYIKDFMQDGILERSDFRRPSPDLIERLLSESLAARRRHARYPKADQHKKQALDWEAEARTYLFRAKRARVLAELLAARLKLLQAGFKAPTRDDLAAALQTGRGREAIQVVLRHVKATHVGIDMLDVIICGAVPPYNALLGGKLVAMLITSPEVAAAYERRYANSPSIIASSMAGKSVVRRPRLVLLGTTSLYGVASSQYNRLKISAEAVGGAEGTEVRYELLGRSLGFGSNHLSPTTVEEIGILLAQSEGGRKVNSIFGEGVNPRLRKIRDGLQLIGLPADSILKHGNTRIVYGISLASNFREVLMGCTTRPHNIFPRSKPQKVTQAIIDMWLERWLSRRIERPEVLDTVEKHSHAYPLSHGAKVVLPPLEEELPLFETL
jgi:Druantia protein DruA